MNIILIRYNQPETEQKCIDSIKQFTDLNKHTLTIYDNYPKNENLGKLWNRLIEESDDETICLLNSDTIVEEGWDRLCDALEDPRAGAVGPITDNCGTKQKGMARGNIEPINDLSGFCYLFTKKTWRRVGKFPEDMPFYGQESIFNRKLEDHGLKLMVDRRVFIHHDKGKSCDGSEYEQPKWGAFHYYNYIRRIKKLREKIPQGTRVVFIGSYANNPFPTFIGIDQTISDFFGTNAIHLPPETPADTIMAFNPDIMIVQNTGGYNKEWFNEIRRVKKQGVKTALYWMDLRNPIQTKYAMGFNQPLNEMYDKLFFVAKGFIKDWEEAFKVKTEWLPQATIQHPIPPKDRFHDIVHVGDVSGIYYHQNRVAILDQFRNAGLNITQFNETIRDKRIEASKRSYGLYGSANYSLSVSPLVEGYTSDRTYHILGAGGCLLMLDPLGLDHLKPYGFICPDGDKMIKTIQDTDANQIEEIKGRAFEYAQSEHLYKDRYIELICKLY
jgi:hypothetical protein